MFYSFSNRFFNLQNSPQSKIPGVNTCAAQMLLLVLSFSNCVIISANVGGDTFSKTAITSANVGLPKPHHLKCEQSCAR